MLHGRVQCFQNDAYKAARSVSIGSLGPVASIRQEEPRRFRGHTRFGEAVSDSPSGAGLETASWLLPISTQES